MSACLALVMRGLRFTTPKRTHPLQRVTPTHSLVGVEKYPLSLWDNAGWTLLLFIMQVTARPLRLQVALTGKWFLLCMPREGGDRPADSRRYCYRASMYRGPSSLVIRRMVIEGRSGLLLMRGCGRIRPNFAHGVVVGLHEQISMARHGRHG